MMMKKIRLQELVRRKISKMFSLLSRIRIPNNRLLKRAMTMREIRTRKTKRSKRNKRQSQNPRLRDSKRL